MFRRIVKNFGPEWGAAVMGTAALCITMQLSSEVARPFSALLYVGLGFYLLTTVMFIAFLIPWTLRFFMYPEEVRKDLRHPIKGNFFPTMPISFILAGTGTNKLGPMLFGPEFSYHLSVIFFFLGVIGIFTFGYLLVRIHFLNSEMRLNDANFSWFIPPVSHLIIPVIGTCLLDVYWAETALASVLFVISMAALGVGFFNFLFVGSMVWRRYVCGTIPQGNLAPTIMIGIAPTAIMVVFLIKFIEAIEASLWGFSFWWLFLVIILVTHYIKIKEHPLGFSWWAYTFPLEAFTVSTGLLAKCVAPYFFRGALIGLNTLAVAIWVVVVFATIKWLESGAFFKQQH